MDEIFWTQKVNGRWKQYQPVRMDKIDNFLPFSIIKWTRRSPDKTNLWGLVNRESTIIAYGVPMQLPYVINRLWLHFLIKKTGKFILIRLLMSQKSQEPDIHFLFQSSHSKYPSLPSRGRELSTN